MLKWLYWAHVLAARAIIVAHYMNEFFQLTEFWITLIEYAGYVCWCATLGMRGWDVQSWTGKTPAEGTQSKIR